MQRGNEQIKHLVAILIDRVATVVVQRLGAVGDAAALALRFDRLDEHRECSSRIGGVDDAVSDENSAQVNECGNRTLGLVVHFSPSIGQRRSMVAEAAGESILGGARLAAA